jgi:hypothetical protein
VSDDDDDDDDNDGLWLELDCESSGRVAIIEDLGDSVWVFLTPPGESSIEQDCWLFNKPSAEADPDLERYRKRSMPPPVPAQLLRPEGKREVPAEERFSARWSKDGNSVVIAIDGVDVALASASLERGMSRYLLEECGWGTPWDDAVLKRLFSQ